MLPLFATCPRGLEPLLADELQRLGATQIEPVGGGLKFVGDWALCYRVNLHSRIATRVLLRLAHAPYRDEEDIYALGRSLPWQEYFANTDTIRVDMTAIRSPLRSLDFTTLRIKDAVCDAFRERTGARPDVDTRAPDVRISAFVDATHCSLYLDTSGEPLYKRGYRSQAGEAPLKENLAAGLVLLSGWHPAEAFLDPMCGSGTLLAEAAWIGLNRAPGLERSFGFEKLRGFDASIWRRLCEEARAAVRTDLKLRLYGSDLYGEALKTARATLGAAGLEECVQLKQANVLELPAPESEGVMLCNPPYGQRLGEAEELAAFYPKLGDALKARFHGWRAYLFSSDMRLAKLIGLKASKRTPLFNGPLECRLFEYRIVAGSNRAAAS